MAGARLPGAPRGDDERIVAHVDVDCFYAACERLREPELRGEPVVVGMGFEAGKTHGAVATASYEAREFGVESAMAISEALDRLPRKESAGEDPDIDPDEAGHYRPVDMAYYESVAADVKAILHERADVVREVSIDEAYLDVTDRCSWNEVKAWASGLKEAIADSVGVIASVGVAPTMSAAKVASDREKPDGLVVVEPGEVRSFFDPLPVEAVHGVGPVTASELAELGIETAGDLASADPEVLADRFGDRGLAVRRYARGEDDREVTPRGRPKSLSRESAFTEPPDEHDEVRERVSVLAAAVADRARRKGALYQTIGIKVVTPPFDVNTRAHSLPGPVEDPDLVESVALDLLSEFADERVRKVGVRVSNLDFDAADQTSLDGWDGGDDPADPGTGDGDPADPGNRDDAADLGAGDDSADPETDGTDSPGREADNADRPDRPGRGQTSLGDFGR